MTVAAETRAAVREHPFLHTALRAGIVNYTAAARFLDVGETEAVAAALRRFADDLDDYEPDERRVSVSMRSGVERISDNKDSRGNDETTGVLSIGTETFTADGGDLTAIVGTGEIDATALEIILGRLRTADVSVAAAGGTDGQIAVVVERRSGPDAVRLVEGTLESLQATH